MEALSLILLAVGCIGVIVSGIWFLIVAFRVSERWGFGCLFAPFVSFIFLIAHWREAQRPFLAQLVACVAIAFGAILSANH